MSRQVLLDRLAVLLGESAAADQLSGSAADDAVDLGIEHGCVFRFWQRPWGGERQVAGCSLGGAWLPGVGFASDLSPRTGEISLARTKIRSRLGGEV
jgi:hypothetical protein